MPRKRALWSEDDLVSAVRAVQRGTLTTYTAAERYKVPRRTIRNHLQTGSLKKTLGRKPILNTEEEAQLVQRIVRYAEIGLPVTPRILRRLVYKYCEQKNIKHNFNNMNKCAGKDWFKAFMKRNPEISIRKAQFMNPARAQKLNKFIVDDHFQKLRDIYDTRDLHDHPERIYNMDEKGCRLTSEASTPGLDQENVPPIDSHQMKTPEPRDGSPSILTEIPIFDVPRGNITPVDFLLPATPEQVNEQSPAVPSTSTGQISRAPAMHRSFYRTIYGSSSSSEESDDLPLSQLKRNEFYDLLPTPDKSQKTPTVRQKAINYRGNSVTKDLFDKFSEEKRKMKEMKKKQKKKEGKERPRREKKRETPKKAKPSFGKKSTTVKGTKKNKKQVGWFCHACEEDRMDAMRRCSRCSKWYHEECVGLSVEDTDEFECPGGCE
uniref:HTH CENPB-type domain-containing protein n=1 Tax=Heliothis virescens TaxID=7102 RepID=A0A2A4J5L2_HELVI